MKALSLTCSTDNTSIFYLSFTYSYSYYLNKYYNSIFFVYSKLKEFSIREELGYIYVFTVIYSTLSNIRLL